jgi:hypothetical protein
VLVDRLIPSQAMKTIQGFIETEDILAKTKQNKLNLISNFPS